MQKQPFDEQLSALVDGELSAEAVVALLAEIEHKPELRTRWLQYQNHYSVQKGEGTPPPRVDAMTFADRVAGQRFSLRGVVFRFLIPDWSQSNSRL